MMYFDLKMRGSAEQPIRYRARRIETTFVESGLSPGEYRGG